MLPRRNAILLGTLKAPRRRDFTCLVLVSGDCGPCSAAGGSGTVATLSGSAPCLLPQGGLGSPRVLRGVLRAALLWILRVTSILRWGDAGAGARASTLPSLRYTCRGCADTRGASHGIPPAFRGLASTKMEPPRHSLRWPCFAMWLHLGRRLFAQRTAEAILNSLCCPGGAFCGCSSVHQKTPLSPQNGCSRPLLEKN